MRIAFYIKAFILNGFAVFRQALKRDYAYESDSVREIKSELMSRKSSFVEDKKNLRKDRCNVANDIHKSFLQISLRNG